MDSLIEDKMMNLREAKPSPQIHLPLATLSITIYLGAHEANEIEE